MTLLEAVATVLGPAIAKAILKKWLKDSTIAADLSSNLIDLIKQKTTDHFTQSKTARQFEAIGERVAESLLTLFEAEGAHIPENGRTAVALAVAQTLDKAGIDTALLAERNLEPRMLADYLFASNARATRDFSEAEKALYERSIQETSQYIVDIAAQLPQFNERTFGELLRRQNQLQDVADRILEEVNRIRQDTREVNHAAALSLTGSSPASATESIVSRSTSDQRPVLLAVPFQLAVTNIRIVTQIDTPLHERSDNE